MFAPTIFSNDLYHRRFAAFVISSVQTVSYCVHWNYIKSLSAVLDTISRVEIRVETALELQKVFVQGAAEFIL